MASILAANSSTLGKQAVLNLGPFAGSRRKMRNCDSQAGLLRQLLEFGFHRRTPAPLLPPESALIRSFVAPGYLSCPIMDHHRLMLSTAKAAVS